MVKGPSESLNLMLGPIFVRHLSHLVSLMIRNMNRIDNDYYNMILLLLLDIQHQFVGLTLSFSDALMITRC